MFTSEYHYKQTHMIMQCDLENGIEMGKKAVTNARLILENYMARHPDFEILFDVTEVDPTAPEFIRKMMDSTIKAGVGPMASVAGGLAEVATDAMYSFGSQKVIANNGGDISIQGKMEAKVGLYGGKNEMAERVGFMIKPEELPLGICTSAGVVGHSISLGDADAVVVFSASAFLSDAAATACANLVKLGDPEASIQNALEKAETIDGVTGCLVFAGSLVGKTGRLPEMVEVIDSDL
jgi:ApbE superfamily uncharacterized protein (UPF0280 family)